MEKDITQNKIHISLRQKGETMSYLDQIVNTLKIRLKWYHDALAIAEGKIVKPIGFGFPSSTNNTFNPESIWEWRGAVRELQNTLDMFGA